MRSFSDTPSTQSQESAWLASASEADLERILKEPSHSER